MMYNFHAATTIDLGQAILWIYLFFSYLYCYFWRQKAEKKWLTDPHYEGKKITDEDARMLLWVLWMISPILFLTILIIQVTRNEKTKRG